MNMSLAKGFTQLGAGLSVGLAGLAAGFAIGIVGDAGVRGTAQQPRLFVGMILILIFAEVLGLYGLIVALIMNTATGTMGVSIRLVLSCFILGSLILILYVYVCSVDCKWCVLHLSRLEHSSALAVKDPCQEVWTREECEEEWSFF